MKQLTIRGFDDELERRLRDLVRDHGISLNQAVLRLLRKGAGIGAPHEQANVVGSALDHLIGTWTDKEAEELMEEVKAFEKIDESMWQ